MEVVRVGLRPPLKRSVFPVQRVGKTMAVRAAADFLFPFFLGKKITETFAHKKKNPKLKKRSSRSVHRRHTF